MILLYLLGVLVSIELTRIHLFVHTDPAYQSVCAVSEGVNCETVAISPYSVFAGLPVSVDGKPVPLVSLAAVLERPQQKSTNGRQDKPFMVLLAVA